MLESSGEENSSKQNKSWGKRTMKTKWENEESLELIDLVEKHGENWIKVANLMKLKTGKQCMQKYKNMMKVKRKGNWVDSEDLLLLKWVEVNGPNKWTQCSRRIKGRCGKQCRERWMNTLDPRVKRGNWEEIEQAQIFRQMQLNWSSWAIIAKALPGRTENAIKNYFYSSIRRLKQTKLFSFIQVTLFPSDFRSQSKFHFESIIYFSKRLIIILSNLFIDKDCFDKPKDDFANNLDKEKLKKTMEILENEYLQMNRLTQKILGYLLEIKADDARFGKFLIGILFGDPFKREYILNGITEEYSDQKLIFRTFVDNHLKAAEKLLMEIQNETEEGGIKMNNRIGTNLLPPHRLKKFKKMWMDEEHKTIKDKPETNFKDERSLGKVQPTNLKINYSNFNIQQPNFNLKNRNNESSPHSFKEEMPESLQKLEKELMSILKYQNISIQYIEHWFFLKEKMSFYKKRFNSFNHIIQNMYLNQNPSMSDKTNLNESTPNININSPPVLDSSAINQNFIINRFVEEERDMARTQSRNRFKRPFSEFNKANEQHNENRFVMNKRRKTKDFFQYEKKEPKG